MKMCGSNENSVWTPNRDQLDLFPLEEGWVKCCGCRNDFKSNELLDCLECKGKNCMDCKVGKEMDKLIKEDLFRLAFNTPIDYDDSVSEPVLRGNCHCCHEEYRLGKMTPAAFLDGDQGLICRSCAIWIGVEERDIEDLFTGKIKQYLAPNGTWVGWNAEYRGKGPDYDDNKESF